MPQQHVFKEPTPAAARAQRTWSAACHISLPPKGPHQQQRSAPGSAACHSSLPPKGPHQQQRELSAPGSAACHSSTRSRAGGSPGAGTEKLMGGLSSGAYSWRTRASSAAKGPSSCARACRGLQRRRPVAAGACAVQLQLPRAPAPGACAWRQRGRGAPVRAWARACVGRRAGCQRRGGGAAPRCSAPQR